MEPDYTNEAILKRRGLRQYKNKTHKKLDFCLLSSGPRGAEPNYNRDSVAAR